MRHHVQLRQRLSRATRGTLGLPDWHATLDLRQHRSCALTVVTACHKCLPLHAANASRRHRRCLSCRPTRRCGCSSSHLLLVHAMMLALAELETGSAVGGERATACAG